QTANWQLLETASDGFSFEVKIGNDPPIHVGKELVSLQRLHAFDVSASHIYKLDAADTKSLDTLTPKRVENKTVIAEIPGTSSRDRAATRALTTFMRRMAALKPSVVVNVSRQKSAATGLAPARAIDPENSRSANFARSERSGPPLVTVCDPRLLALFDSLPVGESEQAVLSVRLDEPVTRPVKVRNVVGLLRGSDPALKDTYVLVTAHYDHVGNQGAPNDKGDHIYNGANDDGSGTVSVVELAGALATLK